jgi:hypothetical protein
MAMLVRYSRGWLESEKTACKAMSVLAAPIFFHHPVLLFGSMILFNLDWAVGRIQVHCFWNPWQGTNNQTLPSSSYGGDLPAVRSGQLPIY